MVISDVEIVKAVKEQLKKKLDNDPDNPVFFYNNNGYKPQDVLDAIDSNTEFGQMVVKEIIKTATELFVKG